MSDERVRILVVDDEASFTRLLRLNLEENGGYSVKTINEPEDVPEAVAAFRPHLILMDIMMPRLFGGDVVKRLRSKPETRTIPVVFVSAAVGKRRVAEHDGVIGGYPFIAKPASYEEIARVIEQTLATQSAGGGGGVSGGRDEWSGGEMRKLE